MDGIKKLTCIVCPLGCLIEVNITDGKDPEITGHACPRGKLYGETEFIRPIRTLTTTIRVEGGELPVLPVKTREPVDKYLLPDIMKILNKISIKAPVSIGQIIIPNILNSGIDIIATRDICELR